MTHNKLHQPKAKARAKAAKGLSRREMLAGAGTLAAGAAAATVIAGRSRAQSVDSPTRKVIDKQPFASLEEVGDGIWAVLSTPINPSGGFNPQTLSNAGLIMGDDAVVVFDSFFRPEGAIWLAEHAKKLTGRAPTHVIVSHLHADHCGGLAGFLNGANSPEIIMTETTRKLIFEGSGRSQPQEGQDFARPAFVVVGPSQVIHDESKTITMDIGGRTITIDPLAGHTASDLALHVDDSDITFASDLVWHGYFPNYVNAVPSKLGPSIAKLRQDPDRWLVSGHGGISRARDLAGYAELVDNIEKGAKASHAAGKTIVEGAKELVIPESTKDWIRFNPRYPDVAYTAWYRELGEQS